jgi:uncharacterized protein (DUF2141 family)
MKSHLSVSALIAAGSFAFTPLVHGGDLAVTISDVRNTAGHIMVSVVNTEAGWNNQEKPVAQDKVAVAGKLGADHALVLHFDLPKGTYAIQVMHDENDNGKIDANFMGIPTEGYGFSNNPHVMRRAYFSEASFEVKDTPTAIVIRMR